MLIHLDDYRRAKPAGRGETAAPRRDWHPAFGVIALPRDARPLESPKLPEDDAAVEPAFMARVCALASQI